jgi:hypothetical protein
MAVQKTRHNYNDTEEGKEVRLKLERMAEDSQFNTTASYSSNTGLYSDNLIPFVDKHMNYLMSHPRVEADKYLANVKLITRAR